MDAASPHRLAGWDHWIIAAGTAFLVLFAISWVIQTRELRARRGLR